MAARKKREPTPAERFAARYPNGYPQLEPPKLPPKPTAKRKAALKRCGRLIEVLKAMDERLDDASLPDADLAEVFDHLDKLWVIHVGTKGNLETHAVLMLAHAIETIDLPNRPDRERADEALAFFRSMYPEYAERLSADDLARADWHGRKKWEVIRSLARKAGLNPASATTIEGQYSRHRTYLKGKGWW